LKEIMEGYYTASGRKFYPRPTQIITVLALCLDRDVKDDQVLQENSLALLDSNKKSVVSFANVGTGQGKTGEGNGSGTR
jgi:hypothetical protein